MMKKILFDFVTLQDENINGGMLYTQKIVYELLQYEAVFYGLYNAKLPISNCIKTIIEKHDVTLLDICDKNIIKCINNIPINVFFIGIAQRYWTFDFSGLQCKIVAVLHDLRYKSSEYFHAHLRQECRKKNTLSLKILKICLYPLVLLKRRYYIKQRKKNDYLFFTRLAQHLNLFIITDSEFSKYSIRYFVGAVKNEITVLYPPFANEFEEFNVSLHKIEKTQDKKYFLLISVDRVEKNAALFFEQWEIFCAATDYAYHCVLIGKIKNVSLPNCVVLEHVSSAELAYLYTNAFAFVFLSFQEGFGYPPVEAAMHGTPSICSNVTSIPEICGDMPIYFSPFYPDDLFRAMIEMTKNRAAYVERAKKRYLEINQRQKDDLQKLIDLILN